MNSLVEEYQRAQQQAFRLKFRYPTLRQMKQMRVLHREVSAEDEDNIDRQRNSARELLRQLEDRRVFAEDLDPVVRDRLRELLNNDKA
jgi:superfamily I DNA and RNA helicase